MSEQANLGRIDQEERQGRRLAPVRLLLPMGWILAAIGFYGPWIVHDTAALTLSGVDMGEFVKFLPRVLDGSLAVVRQFYYLPPLATVLTVALLVGARRLDFSWFLQLAAIALSIPVSLQLLPPAWSLASLATPEFRLQALALGACWLFLASFRMLGRLPSWLSGSFAAVLALAALLLPTWQMVLVKPHIDTVYGVPPNLGWGFWVCTIGLALVLVASLVYTLGTRLLNGASWAR